MGNAGLVQVDLLSGLLVGAYVNTDHISARVHQSSESTNIIETLKPRPRGSGTVQNMCVLKQRVINRGSTSTTQPQATGAGFDQLPSIVMATIHLR